MSAVVFLCAQYLAHRMAGSTWSSRTRNVSSRTRIRIFMCSVPSPPHGRQYMKLLYQGCQYSSLYVLSVYLAHRMAGSTMITITVAWMSLWMNVIAWMSYVCPNIIPYLCEKHNKKFEERERGIFRSIGTIVYLNVRKTFTIWPSVFAHSYLAS
jgi:hypothetical protein